MNKKLIITLLAGLLPTLASAHNLEIGQVLPSVDVADKGEILLTQDKIAYQAWATEQLVGKVRVIQAIAGRSAAKEMNAPMIDAIKAADLPTDKYQTTTIINQDDAIWGTGGFVKSSAEDSKREFAWSSMVLDANGNVQQAWDLQQENSMIALLDAKGTVLFAQEGQLSEQDIQRVLKLINNNL
ncbi:YtfJ family protein [Photobacterium sanguinicancri]|uniref:YtfJ family protein n=1 Tax=Photobacterium sanguinicancri TaxID=875932 RepID=UPI0026E15F22|nr:YtfJ family protein [Photobacterium sanguinicancri]MDO6499802.1 YtfJ family protein [Photobacterium sanguinicancri]